METAVGRRVVAAVDEPADSFDRIYLQAFVESFPGVGEEDAALTPLARRMREVLNAERAQATSEVLHARVLRRLRDLDLPLLPMLAARGVHSDENFGEVEPRRFVAGLYSTDALAMVQQYIMSIIQDWEHLSRDFPLQLSLFQAGQLYAASARFGYAIQKIDARYQLEKAVDNVAADSRSFVDYFGDALGTTTIASQEAEDALSRHVTALFGDMEALEHELVKALDLRTEYEATKSGGVVEDAVTMLQQFVADEKVASVRMSVSSLRRLALEGCAFGFLLSAVEGEIGSAVELAKPPSVGRQPRGPSIDLYRLHNFGA